MTFDVNGGHTEVTLDLKPAHHNINSYGIQDNCKTLLVNQTELDLRETMKEIIHKYPTTLKQRSMVDCSEQNHQVLMSQQKSRNAKQGVASLRSLQHMMVSKHAGESRDADLQPQQASREPPKTSATSSRPKMELRWSVDANHEGR